MGGIRRRVEVGRIEGKCGEVGGGAGPGGRSRRRMLEEED